jgi:hypothetical protein
MLKIRGDKMKKEKQWKQPDLSLMKQRSANKVIASSRNGQVRYSTGIGPTPPTPYSTGIGPTPPTPVPPMNPDLV